MSLVRLFREFTGIEPNLVITEDDDYPCLLLNVDHLPAGEFAYATYGDTVHMEYLDSPDLPDDENLRRRIIGILTCWLNENRVFGLYGVVKWKHAKVDVLAENDDRYNQISFYGFKQQGR